MLVERALSSRRIGPYTLQAAIAAVHAESTSAAATDWAQIVGLYDVLARAEPSPVVELNRAVAVAMRDGPEAGLALVDAILARGELSDYRLAHAARADLCRRLGKNGRSPGFLRAGARPHPPGAGAAVPRAAPGGARQVNSCGAACHNVNACAWGGARRALCRSNRRPRKTGRRHRTRGPTQRRLRAW